MATNYEIIPGTIRELTEEEGVAEALKFFPTVLTEEHKRQVAESIVRTNAGLFATFALSSRGQAACKALKRMLAHELSNHSLVEWGRAVGATFDHQRSRYMTLSGIKAVRAPKAV